MKKRFSFSFQPKNAPGDSVATSQQGIELTTKMKGQPREADWNAKQYGVYQEHFWSNIVLLHTSDKEQGIKQVMNKMKKNNGVGRVNI